MNEPEFRKPWDIFKIYLQDAIDHFESYEEMTFEECTHRDRLREILGHVYELQYFRKTKNKTNDITQ